MLLTEDEFRKIAKFYLSVYLTVVSIFWISFYYFLKLRLYIPLIVLIALYLIFIIFASLMIHKLEESWRLSLDISKISKKEYLVRTLLEFLFVGVIFLSIFSLYFYKRGDQYKPVYKTKLVFIIVIIQLLFSMPATIEKGWWRSVVSPMAYSLNYIAYVGTGALSILSIKEDSECFKDYTCTKKRSYEELNNRNSTDFILKAALLNASNLKSSLSQPLQLINALEIELLILKGIDEEYRLSSDIPVGLHYINPPTAIEILLIYICDLILMSKFVYTTINKSLVLVDGIKSLGSGKLSIKDKRRVEELESHIVKYKEDLILYDIGKVIGGIKK
ncbi:hypothetical protein [Halobacteriovorax sp. YZS-1-1]|uniref:hypothetical protein n=1 Tax=unclassified Halobacteriovorax TaxID=2639665 RepID=UPI00399A6B2C